MEHDPFEVQPCSSNAYNFQPVDEQALARSSTSSATKRRKKIKVLLARAQELEEQQQWQM